ncbi:class I SAM-dependent methyltransferase [Nostoc sp. UHCC 0302]|uniref:class I SAM-dependent methyltransferase n=1 Tax=Nostoc sp. UHCC 0302 TaxID=3134896 RepID=UPI00311CC5B8
MTETTVRKQYNQLAAVYDLRWRNYIVNTLSFLKTWVEISPTDTVLDIACGTGEFERLLLTEYSSQQIVGIDISEEMLAMSTTGYAYAKLKFSAYPQVSFQTASASRLPFGSNSFDVIVSANSFHYFDEPLVVLKEMRRVLKADGKVIILDWCKDYLVCKICDLVLKVFDPAYKQCYTQNQFHYLLNDENFMVCRATKIRFGVVWGLMVATAKVKT